MENEEIKVNVTRKDIWKRAVYMLIFVLAYSVAEFILGAIVIFQFLMVLITKETNEVLKDFSVQLCKYIYQIVRYLSFNTEYQPYPFNQWPQVPDDAQSSGRSTSHSDDVVIDENADVGDPLGDTSELDVSAAEIAVDSDNSAEVDGAEVIVADNESTESTESTEDAKNKPDHT